MRRTAEMRSEIHCPDDSRARDYCLQPLLCLAVCSTTTLSFSSRNRCDVLVAIKQNPQHARFAPPHCVNRRVVKLLMAMPFMIMAPPCSSSIEPSTVSSDSLEFRNGTKPEDAVQEFRESQKRWNSKPMHKRFSSAKTLPPRMAAPSGNSVSPQCLRPRLGYNRSMKSHRRSV